MNYEFNKEIKIGKSILSEKSPTFIIAEAGVNHNGDMDLAKKLIDVAVLAGADAVKFQAFKTEELILDSVEKAPYQKKSTDAEETQFDMLKKLELKASQFLLLKDYCDKKQILFLITPFDDESLEDLDALKLDAYKISSTDLTNLPFLRKVAKKGKPIILSSGMSFLEEVELALKEILTFNNNVILLHCTANYPVANHEVNLNVLSTFKEKFGILVGYSDHSVELGASPYAVALGAKVIEKHFTLDKNLPGPDQKASLSPEELNQFVKEIRKVEQFLGTNIKSPQLSEIATRNFLQKNLVARTNIKRGEIFSDLNVVAKRSGGKGISPIYYSKVFGTEAKTDFKKNELIII